MQKKNLLITTALATLLSASAFADGASPSILGDMSVKIGGLYDVKFISREPSKRSGAYLTTNNTPGVDSNAQIYIEAKNSTAKGLEYGAHIGMRTNTVSSRQPQVGIDRSWIWMEHSDMGRLEIGSNNDTSESIRIGADRVATATGGINGDWFKVLSRNNFVASSFEEFHLKPWGIGDNRLDLSFNDGAVGGDADVENDHFEKSRKANYYSPKRSGFQVGVSYVFDTANVGYATSMPDDHNSLFPSQAADVTDLFSGGISWDGNISNDIKASTSLVVMYGNIHRGNLAFLASEQLAAFDIGGMVSRDKLKAAASFGYTGKTGYLKGTTGSMAKGWYVTAGLNYEFDKLVTSLTYLHGSKNKNISDIISVGADYHLASGVIPYAEITHYKMDLKRTGGLAMMQSDNSNSSYQHTVVAANEKYKGTAFIVGTKLSF